jgi:hypothetical protein
MAASKRSAQSINQTMARALELAEEALHQVARIAIEEIHTGLESRTRVEAAERDMRSALRQLVLADRELRSKSGPRAGLDDRTQRVAEVVPGPVSDDARSGA